jgi:pimeloyl-ACP methyl ester carboxylesterase
VFYGVRDYPPVEGSTDPALNPPVRCRVFFPSIDGAVMSAPILRDCCRFPLIVFVHGNCDEPDHHMKWYLIPAQLARSGYVVVAPMLVLNAGGMTPPWDNPTELQQLRDLIAWMRTVWEHSDVLMPAPATGAIGHSYGALLAARLAPAEPISALGSLSGVWGSWPPDPPTPLWDLTMPKLLMWGSGFDSRYALDASRLRPPWHTTVLEDGEHWDYLSEVASRRCEWGDLRGPCTHVPALAADIASTFFGKYLPPECWRRVLEQWIPDSLLPPPLTNLTNEEQFFGAGGHLTAFRLIGSGSACRVTLSWATLTSTGSLRSTGSLIRPR